MKARGSGSGSGSGSSLQKVAEEGREP